jgi:putative molybdopterin biosynthesis protein
MRRRIVALTRKRTRVRTLEEMPDVLTMDEVAEVMRIGRNSAYEAVRSGQLPSRTIGRRKVVPREALRAYLAGAR